MFTQNSNQIEWRDRVKQYICPSLWFPVSFPVFSVQRYVFKPGQRCRCWRRSGKTFGEDSIAAWSTSGSSWVDSVEFVGICGEFCAQKKVGDLEPWNFMTFHLLGIIIPTDKLIFFRGVETTNQLMIIIVLICIDHDHHDHIFINPPFVFSPLRTNQVGLFQWPQVKPKRRCFPWAF